MKFSEIVAQASALLQRKGRITYRALQREFTLDEAALADLKDELIEGEQVARDENSKVLVWTGKGTEEEPENRGIGESEKKQTTPSDSGLSTPDARHDAGERRQLTVMFCDVVGSTALSEQLDPEELREVMQAYQHACVTVITRFDGHVAKYLGDGLLVYFGYPIAHEDDAQRAVRAGLGIVEAVQALPQADLRLPHPLQVRVGIHTGLVVAGEMGSGEYREQLAIVGETPNIAARLQEKAGPNSVVISPTTYHLVTGLFDCQDLGAQTLKGISTPVSVYQVIGESSAQSRLDVELSTGRLIPLVGRANEVGLILERWAAAQAGDGQVVLLGGEPGIGKSRLVQEVKERVLLQGATYLEFRCSPYHQNSAFYPVITHLQRVLHFERDEPPQTRLEKLQQMLVHYRFPQADTLLLLAALLSLSQPEGTPPLTLSPQKQKQKTQEALVAWLVEEAERAPVYSVWEDLHWADPSTVDLLGLLLDQVPTTRLLVLLTARPEFAPPWSSRTHGTPLTLGRLPRTQAAEMIEKVTGGKPLPTEVQRQIVSKTDGVPLFVEELTKMVLESGLLRETNGHYELSGPLPPLAIPSTLHDSLRARLDRLATGKEVAQIGATLGREFSYHLLQAVSPLDEVRLHQALAKLVEAEVLYQRGQPPQAHYLFKHALIQDTAYQSLLKSTRQQLHQQIAQVLEECFPDTKEKQPELLAHHYTEAGFIAQAIPYWQQAGQRAVARSAHVEAVAHLTKGLALLNTLPDTPERARQELELQIALGVPLTVTKGYATPEVEAAATRALELCRQVGETPQTIPALFQGWWFYSFRGEFETARELAERLISVAQRVDDSAALAVGHRLLAQILYACGEGVSARAHLEQALALYDPQQCRSLIARFGVDWGVNGFAILAHVLWALGYPDQARTRSRAGLVAVQKVAHPLTTALFSGWDTVLHQALCEVQAVQQRAEALLALSNEQGFPQWSAFGFVFRGWALVMLGQTEDGLNEIHQGVARSAPVPPEVRCALLAEAYGKTGQVERGLTTLTEALEAANRTGWRMYEAELYRLRGELTLAQASVQSRESRAKKAEEYFLKAIDIARKQQAKSLELRATASLARLWQQQGKRQEAHRMLSEIYGWFTEGFDTKDLQEAKALLEGVSRTLD